MKMLSFVGKEGLGSKLGRPLSPTTVQGAARLRAMLVIIAILYNTFTVYDKEDKNSLD